LYSYIIPLWEGYKTTNQFFFSKATRKALPYGMVSLTPLNTGVMKTART
jgi:hypothetical protein